MKTLFIYLIVFMFLIAGTVTAQDRQITGKVSTSSGGALAGVTIIVKGTAIGTYSKSDGSYKVNVPKNSKTLLFRRVGTKPKEIEIGTNNEINVVLEEDNVLMDEVVVTAIGLERNKRSLGYATEEVSSRQI